LEHQAIGVIVLGREMKKLVSDNKELEERLIRIMEQAICEDTPLLSLMINDAETETIADKKVIMQYLSMGFRHKETGNTG